MADDQMPEPINMRPALVISTAGQTPNTDANVTQQHMHARNASDGVPQLTLTNTQGDQTEFQAPPSPHPSEGYSASLLSDGKSEDGNNSPLTSLALRSHDPQVAFAQQQKQLSPVSASSHRKRGSVSSEREKELDSPSEAGGQSYTSNTPLHDLGSNASTKVNEKDVASGGVERPTKFALGENPNTNEPSSTQKRSFKDKIMFWRKNKDEEDKEHATIDTTVPDPSPEQMRPFSLPPSQLYSYVAHKNYDALVNDGGAANLETALHTSSKTGIDENPASSGSVSPDDRRRVYLSNEPYQAPTKGLLALMWAAFQDRVLILLSIAAVISLALGIYQAVGQPPVIVNGEPEPQVQWVEGLAIIVAVLIVVIVGSLNDYQKEKQFKKLNAQKEERNVKVIRNGKERLMNVYEVLVGDLLELEPGEIVPVDGVLVSGNNVKCDESSATGESDAIRKIPYEQLKEEREMLQRKGQEPKKSDCFILSGSKVTEGHGRYIVTCVGQHSFMGRLLRSLQDRGSQITPLQTKLNILANRIAQLGTGAGLLLFTCLMIRFFVELKTQPDRTADQKAQNFIQILIIAVTVIVVAVPEGLPLAVTVALAFATRRMTQANLLVRVLASCETMANATVICTDKTGTLTQNVMSVVAGSVGIHLKFADRLAENAGRQNANDDLEEEVDGNTTPKIGSTPPTSAPPSPASPGGTSLRRRGRLDFSMDMADINKAMSLPLRKLFNDSIALNSTAFEGEDEKGRLSFVGSKTETALLAFCKQQGWQNYQEARDQHEVLQVYAFSSDRKASGIVVRLPNGGARFFAKGASEVLQKRSTRHVHVADPSSTSFSEQDKQDNSEVRVIDFTDETRANVERSIIFYANQSLRTIAVCYRDYPTWPPKGAHMDSEGNPTYESVCLDLTLLAITAIEDPLRPGVTQSVATCLKAGVAVKMCTGDNVLTARSIATQCGIYTPGGLIMEGPVFRSLSYADKKEVAPRLQVLARSLPDDKRTLVELLMKQGEVVGVTGDGMNDAPALKSANVGFVMGIAGTEVAKEASDIILMDDNFASIVTAIMWGRCVNGAVRKFLQFQISVNIVAVLLTFISSVASSDEESVLTAVQLLWINLIMDTFAALALATDPASPESLKHKPDRLSAPLITTDMWKMIVGQSIYQLTVCLVLHFAGASIFHVDDPNPAVQLENEQKLSTLVFNSFTFCQIFNQLNSRVLDRSFNIFAGFWKNYWFMGIFCIMVGGQALIVNVGGAAFSVERINGIYWAISIIIGLISLPIGVLIRLVPTEPVERALIRFKLMPDPNALPTVDPEKSEEQYNEGIEKVIDNLKVLSTVRGGRTRSSSIVRMSRKHKLQDGVTPGGLMAMVPALVISSVGAGWRPTSGNGKGSLSNPAGEDPSKSSAALWTNMMEVHPDTDPSDPIFEKYHISPTVSPHQSPRPSSHRSPSAGGRHSRSPSAVSHLSSAPTIPETLEESGPSSSLKPPQA